MERTTQQHLQECFLQGCPVAFMFCPAIRTSDSTEGPSELCSICWVTTERKEERLMPREGGENNEY